MPGNTSSATVTPDFPKVVPVKTAVTTGLAYAGVPFTWKITLTNSGTGRAYNLGAVDTLPVNWTYDAGTAKVTTGNGSPVAVAPTVGAAGSAGPTLTWAGLAPLAGAPTTDGIAPGQSVVITFDATPGSDAPTAAGTGHPNVNNVTASTTDATGAPGNSVGPYASGTGSATALIAAADVQLVKTAGTFTAGDSGTWTLTATNNGPDTAVGPFLITDTVPRTLTLPGGGTGAALTLQSATGIGWSCTRRRRPGRSPVPAATARTRCRPATRSRPSPSPSRSPRTPSPIRRRPTTARSATEPSTPTRTTTPTPPRARWSLPGT